ncbi:MAG: hypothetical protein IPP87_03615 [Ideonella sp.]|nr:hypothetical protein [Ideonella sp.]
MSRAELKKKWWIAAKPKNAKGAELEKALGLVEQADGEKRAALLAALAPAIAKASAELEKLDKKANKDLLKDLAELEDMAQDEAKKILASAAKAKAEAEKKAQAHAAKKGEDHDDEEEESPELLTTKLKTLLRQVAKGESMHALLAKSGKQVVVMLSRKPIPPARRKMLADQLGGGSTKYYPGHCSLEAGATTFVLRAEVAGMTKLVKAALLEQTGLRMPKVKCRGEDGDDEDGDADELPESEPDVETPPDDKRPVLAQQAAEDPAAAAAAPARAAEVAAAAAAPSTKTPEAATAPEAPVTPQQVEVLEDRRRQFKQARAAWVAVKARAEQDLEKVKDGAHMAYMADPAQFPKMVAGCKAIDEILDNLDDELRDTLDQYASTPLRNQRKLQALAATASETLDRYQKFVASNALMKAIDEKEFADVSIHAPVTKALAVLRKALG